MSVGTNVPLPHDGRIERVHVEGYYPFVLSRNRVFYIRTGILDAFGHVTFDGHRNVPRIQLIVHHRIPQSHLLQGVLKVYPRTVGNLYAQIEMVEFIIQFVDELDVHNIVVNKLLIVLFGQSLKRTVFIVRDFLLAEFNFGDRI